MAAELQLDASRCRALDRNLFADDAQRFPGAVEADLVGVGGVDFLDVDIVLIGAGDGEPPRETIVVADGHADKRRLSRTDDVPARRVQVDDVAK